MRHHGRKAEYSEERERVGNTLGDVPREEFARPGGHGEVVRGPSGIRPAPERTRGSGEPQLVDVVDRPGRVRPRNP
nr:hypothetical protein [Streptomyces sp. WMMB 322]